MSRITVDINYDRFLVECKHDFKVILKADIANAIRNEIEDSSLLQIERLTPERSCSFDVKFQGFIRVITQDDFDKIHKALNELHRFHAYSFELREQYDIIRNIIK